jgi:hypothetical protein
MAAYEAAKAPIAFSFEKLLSKIIFMGIGVTTCDSTTIVERQQYIVFVGVFDREPFASANLDMTSKPRGVTGKAPDSTTGWE